MLALRHAAAASGETTHDHSHRYDRPIVTVIVAGVFAAGDLSVDPDAVGPGTRDGP
jgi:hypothetical protein